MQEYAHGCIADKANLGCRTFGWSYIQVGLYSDEILHYSKLLLTGPLNCHKEIIKSGRRNKH